MNKEIKLLVTTASFYILAIGMLMPFYAIFVGEINGDISLVGVSFSIFTLTAGIFVYFISKWEDHVHHKEKLLILSYGMRIFIFLSFIFISKPYHLFITQFFLGIAEAISGPVFNTLYSTHLDKGKFTSEWGLLSTAFFVISALAALVGGFIIKSLGFQSLFLLMAGISAVSFFVSIYLYYIEKKKDKVEILKEKLPSNKI